MELKILCAMFGAVVFLVLFTCGVEIWVARKIAVKIDSLGKEE